MSQVSHARQRGFHEHPPASERSLDAARALVMETAARLWPGRERQRLRLSATARSGATPVVAEPIRADRAWPPFRRAMRDGYALRSAEAGQPLRCAGEVRAGGAAARACEPGACLAIMTGAAVPDGLDTVVMIEHTQLDGEGLVLIDGGIKCGENIAPVGSDSAAGAVVVERGRRLSAAALAAAASAGVTDPVVYAAPRVAIVASGDELVAADAQPGSTQIRNSNGPMLAAQCRRYGAEIVLQQLVADDAGQLEAALHEALLREADVVVFSGGASVGSADLVAPLLASLGVRLAFDAVKVRPGRPVLFGELGGRLYFGLPGNPLGALMACALLLRPALELLSGLEGSAVSPATVSAVMGFDYHGHPLELDAFRPVRLVVRQLRAEVQQVRYHGSADLAAAAAADGFLHIAPGVTVLPTGASVGVVLP